MTVKTCERTWPASENREDTYPQHRCGKDAGHNGPDQCRYCGATRTGRYS